MNKQGKGGLSIFPDFISGFGTQIRGFTTSDKWKDTTLRGMISKYAPEADGNDPELYTKRVSNETGIPNNTYMKALTLDQKVAIAKAMLQEEGYFSPINKTYHIGDPNNPKWVDSMFILYSDTSKGKTYK